MVRSADAKAKLSKLSHKSTIIDKGRFQGNIGRSVSSMRMQSCKRICPLFKPDITQASRRWWWAVDSGNYRSFKKSLTGLFSSTTFIFQKVSESRILPLSSELSSQKLKSKRTYQHGHCQGTDQTRPQTQHNCWNVGERPIPAEYPTANLAAISCHASEAHTSGCSGSTCAEGQRCL
jgi:hypothetical protein